MIKKLIFTALLVSCIFVFGCSSSKKIETAPTVPPSNASSFTKIRGVGIPVLAVESYTSDSQKSVLAGAAIAAAIVTLGHGSAVGVPDNQNMFSIVLFQCGCNVAEHSLDAPRIMPFFEGEILIHYVKSSDSESDFELREKFTANEKGIYALISSKKGYEARSGNIAIEGRQFKIEKGHSYTLTFPECRKE